LGEPLAVECLLSTQDALSAVLSTLSPRLSHEAFPVKLISTLTHMVGELNMKHRMFLQWIRRFPVTDIQQKELRHTLAFAFASKLLQVDIPYPTKDVERLESLIKLLNSIKLYDEEQRERRAAETKISQRAQLRAQSRGKKNSSAPPKRKKRKGNAADEDADDAEVVEVLDDDSEDGSWVEEVPVDEQEDYNRRLQAEAADQEGDKTDYRELYSVIKLAMFCLVFDAKRLTERPLYEKVC
jgi:hypothetical protein